MVMIVPIDNEVGETQQVAEKFWPKMGQVVERVAVWWAKFEHHDCDDDRKYSVAEGFDAIG